jgi:hypothetical protein
VSKWKSVEPAISKSFDDEYFGWRQRWYACVSPPGIPSTNNGQESFNNVLKNNGLNQKKMKTGVFLKHLKSELKNLSSIDEHGAPFPETFALSSKAWKTAQQWAASVNNLVFPSSKECQFFVPCSSLIAQR